MTTSQTRVGLYPGAFDPVTNGHLDIIRRACKLVDKLVIGVTTNASKTPLFTLAERVEMLEQECRDLSARLAGKPGGKTEIIVRPFDTLLIKYAESVGASLIIRGLRAVSDFEYEFQMVGMNQKLNPDIETVFLIADPAHQAIASRLVKEISAYGGAIDAFVPAEIARRLKAKHGGK